MLAALPTGGPLPGYTPDLAMPERAFSFVASKSFRRAERCSPACRAEASKHTYRGFRKSHTEYGSRDDRAAKRAGFFREWSQRAPKRCRGFSSLP
jgi:hypothetical protein